jgi:tRNA dimethylallyltransferase
VIAGPTGSGKSELALRVAEEFGGEVIGCDSLQVYRHFDIGTAKLRAPERRGVPHYLIDIADPDCVFTAGEYARRARAMLGEITARRHLPVVAGGTGFYLRALLDGLFEGPERDEKLRRRLAVREAKRPGSLHRLLSRFDPAAAAKIHANDVPKVMRALEVCLLTQRPVTELFQEGRDALRGYAVLKIGLAPAREVLYEKLDTRCGQMFEAGLIEEAQNILSLGFSPNVKPFESHGYKQALQIIQGELSRKDALFYAQRNTRRYAKRQMTWFRQERDVRWFPGFGDTAEIQSAVIEKVRQFLEAHAALPSPNESPSRR